MDKISRSKLARHTTRRIIDGEGQAALQELAAYLIDSRRTREADLVVRAIYEELERAGIVIADITSAEGLDSDIRTALATLIGAEEFVPQETIDQQVLGGVLVRTPSRVLDATFARRLAKLREHKV